MKKNLLFKMLVLNISIMTIGCTESKTVEVTFNYKNEDGTPNRYTFENIKKGETLSKYINDMKTVNVPEICKTNDELLDLYFTNWDKGSDYVINSDTIVNAKYEEKGFKEIALNNIEYTHVPESSTLKNLKLDVYVCSNDNAFYTKVEEKFNSISKGMNENYDFNLEFEVKEGKAFEDTTIKSLKSDRELKNHFVEILELEEMSKNSKTNFRYFVSDDSNGLYVADPYKENKYSFSSFYISEYTEATEYYYVHEITHMLGRKESYTTNLLDGKPFSNTLAAANPESYYLDPLNYELLNWKENSYLCNTHNKTDNKYISEKILKNNNLIISSEACFKPIIKEGKHNFRKGTIYYVIEYKETCYSIWKYEFTNGSDITFSLKYCELTMTNAQFNDSVNSTIDTISIIGNISIKLDSSSNGLYVTTNFTK